MKKILSLDNNEKNRILEMHRNAIKKSFLIEQTTSTQTSGVTQSGDTKYAEVDTNKPQRAETEYDKARKQRIATLLSRTPKYGFIEKGGFLNRKQDLDVQLTNITMTSDNGKDSVFISGKIGQQSDSGQSPYVGDIVFIYRCREGEFELYRRPKPNPSYTGIDDDETGTPIEKTKKVKKLKRADVGDRYYSNDLSKWLRANLFICGTKYQTTVQ